MHFVYDVFMLTFRQVWFQNARAKYRRNAQKESKDLQQVGPTAGDSRPPTADSRLSSCRPNCSSMGDMASPRGSAAASGTTVAVAVVEDVASLSPTLLELNPLNPYCPVAQSPSNLCSTSQLPDMCFMPSSFSSIT